MALAPEEQRSWRCGAGIVEPEGLQVAHPRAAGARGRPGRRPRRGDGVSFAEQQMRRGKYYDQPPFPFVPGYDLVGVVERLGDGGPAIAVGQRVAALTKTGGWADRVVARRRPTSCPPGRCRPVAAETVVVNGVTAWRMLHRTARVRRVRRSSCSARPAASAPRSSSSPATRASASSAPPARGTRTGCASSARSPSTTATRTSPPACASSRRTAWRPSSTTSAGPGIVDSWRMLARGGTLVSYGTASTRDDARQPAPPGAQAAREADGLEPHAERTPRDVLQPLGRPPAAPARYRAELRRGRRGRLRRLGRVLCRVRGLPVGRSQAVGEHSDHAVAVLGPGVGRGMAQHGERRAGGPSRSRRHAPRRWPSPRRAARPERARTARRSGRATPPMPDRSIAAPARGRAWWRGARRSGGATRQAPLRRLVRGGQRGCGVRTGIDLMLEDGDDQVRAPREVPVERPDPDPRPVGDLLRRGVHARRAEDDLRRLEQGVDVALGVGARRRGARESPGVVVSLNAPRFPERRSVYSERHSAYVQRTPSRGRC